MAFELEPELAAAMAPILELMSANTPPPPGDVPSRRAMVEALFAQLHPPMPDAITITEHETTSSDGATIALRWYAPDGSAPGSAALYIHGGGMILGSLDVYHEIIASIVAASGVPMLAVEYRLAPEHPHPAPVEDCYAGLQYLAANAGALGVDPARIAVMGDSAGGGLAAGVALLARDRGGPALARQILIYPMLDDRTTTPDPLIAPFAVWTYDDNVTGWGALLDGKDADHYAAPARVEDPAGLADAYIEVGELDIFRDEDVEYAQRLSAAGVSTELHVIPGAPHAFELFGAQTALAQRSAANRVRILQSL